ncbi:MAG: preprotein translocase subunit YajC [Acidimicrobiia bacterium]
MSSHLSKGGTMQNLAPIITLSLFIVIMYFLLVRPQKQRMAEQARLVNSLEVGDEVLTSAGIFGRIKRMNDDRLELETAGGTRLEILKSTVVRRISDEAMGSKNAVDGKKSGKALEGGKGSEDLDSLE